MKDQKTYEQTQRKRRKSKKLKQKFRVSGTTAIAKQRKLKSVNKTFLQLEKDYKNLLAVGVRNRREIARLNSLLSARVMSEVEAYNEGISAFAWWKDGVQYVGTCGKLLKDALK